MTEKQRAHQAWRRRKAATAARERAEQKVAKLTALLAAAKQELAEAHRAEDRAVHVYENAAAYAGAEFND